MDNVAIWVDDYQPGPWLSFLSSGFVAYVVPVLIILVGFAMAAAVPFFLIRRRQPPFFGLEGVIGGRTLSRQKAEESKLSSPAESNPMLSIAFWIASGLSIFIVLCMVLGLMLGAGTVEPAAQELQTASQEMAVVISLARGLNTTAVDLVKDFDDLFNECPPRIADTLGGAIGDLKRYGAGIMAEASALASSMLPLSQGLDGMISRMDYVSSKLTVPIHASLIVSCLCLISAAASVAATQMQHIKMVKKLSPIVLPYLLPASTSFAAVVLSLSAMTEFRLANQVSSYCVGNAGDASLSYVAAAVGGEQSESYLLAHYYLKGERSNPATARLLRAEGLASESLGWIRKYQYIIQQTCPQWAPKNVTRELFFVHKQLNQTSDIIAPTKIYPFYSSAIHQKACTGSAAGLGRLALSDVFLGLLCFPALAFTTAWHVDSLLSRSGFERLPQHEEDRSAGDLMTEKEFNPLYYVVYGISVFVFLVGTYMYFMPTLSVNIVRPISGTLLYASGIFMIMNSDLLVTMVRLYVQVGEFRKNNKKFEISLQAQAKIVRRLQTAAQGFKQIDSQFGGLMKKAMKEVGQQEQAARANVALTCGSLCRLYCDIDHDHRIEAGAELEKCIDLMATVFGPLVGTDLRDKRLPELKKGLLASEEFKTAGCPFPVFAQLLEKAMLANDIKSIAADTQRLMDQASLAAPPISVKIATPKAAPAVSKAAGTAASLPLSLPRPPPETSSSHSPPQSSVSALTRQLF